MHLADLGFKSTSIEPVVTEAYHDYAIREEDLPVIFEQYELLAREYVKRIKEERGLVFSFMIDLQGPCVIRGFRDVVRRRIFGYYSGRDIYPCHQFVGDKNFKIGTVTEE